MFALQALSDARFPIIVVGLNGSAVVGASLAGGTDRGYLLEGRDRRLGWLEQRMTSMSALRERMIADMTSAGLAASTKAVYIQGVRALAAYYRRSPDQLSEGEVRSCICCICVMSAVRRATLPAASWRHPVFLCPHARPRLVAVLKKEFVRASASVCPMSCRTPRLARSLAA
jgi:hypothetical protein